MWKVYCDNNLIFDSNIEGLKIFNPTLNIELNKVGSFTFTIYPSNTHYGKLRKLKSIISVYKKNKLVFKGRILNDTSQFHNEKQIVCESDLAFFIDTQQRYIAQTINIGDFIDILLQDHNLYVEEEKTFKKGNIWASSDIIEISEANYCTTLEALNKLVEIHGGYLWIRHEEDGNYLDYLEDFTTLSNQTIEFGKNLLDFSQITKGEDIATAIIPLGKDGITIASINDGVDYIVNEEAIEQYGFICKTVQFTNLVNRNDLLNEARKWLEDNSKLVVSLELSAIDLAGLNADFNSFELGTYVQVNSTPHNISQKFLTKKISINLLNPKSNKLTLGTTYSTFTEQSFASSNATKEVINNVKGFVAQEELNEAIRETEEKTYSVMNQSADEILTKVSQDYVSKGENEALIESINTEFEQTNQAFDFRFNEFSQNIEEVANGSNAQFQEISKYIRFIDGNIVLGQENNELGLKITSERIEFLVGGNVIAYFSNRNLIVANGEFEETLKLGNFGFIPRTDGSLSFKKVK